MADANVFELVGEHIQISYSARGPFVDQPGLVPTFTYQDQDLNLTFKDKQIRSEQSEMGTLISVSLKVSVDAGATILTILLPAVNLGDTAEQHFKTFAIVTETFGMLPRVGARQVYQHALKLNGVGRFLPLL